jgi:hypothetical protein
MTIQMIALRSPCVHCNDTGWHSEREDFCTCAVGAEERDLAAYETQLPTERDLEIEEEARNADLAGEPDSEYGCR